MYRYFCRRRRFFFFTCVYVILCSLLILISDDSMEGQKQFHAKVHRKVYKRVRGSNTPSSVRILPSATRRSQTLRENTKNKATATESPMKRMTDRLKTRLAHKNTIAHTASQQKRQPDDRQERKSALAHTDDRLKKQLDHRQERRSRTLAQTAGQRKRQPDHRQERRSRTLAQTAGQRKRQPDHRQERKNNENEKRLQPEEAGTHEKDEFSQDTAAEWKPPPNPGEKGKAVRVNETLLSQAQLKRYREGKQLHRFNVFLSDLISLHRSPPSLQDPECQSQQYLKELLTTSVVIIYHNEAWSTLLRTVHSVLDRSPPHLLDHIILVDDFSDLPHLGKPLDDYLSRPELHKVKVVRSKSRGGLITARLLGLSYVTSPTVVFLDSHCECAEGWLEPLLDRIARDPTTVVVPVIDSIDMDTFQFHLFAAKHISVGTFVWGMTFQWMPIQPSEKKRRTSVVEPIRTPTMAGGLFAIDRAFFHKLGTYDPEMRIWGGENLELSFKIWMCGGTLETVPCSHVGHVFRSMSPHSTGGFSNYLSKNLGRLSAVWLDDYSYYANKARHVNKTEVLKSIGDISERLELKRRLQCHSFGWYMKNVMPERFFPADQIAHGPIVNEATELCIASIDEKKVHLRKCIGPFRDGDDARWNTYPDESGVKLESFRETYCLDYSPTEKILSIFTCHGQGGNQHWRYIQKLKQMYHVRSGLCLEQADEDTSPTLFMAKCDPENPLQRWLWDTSPVPGPSWRRDLAAGKPVL